MEHLLLNCHGEWNIVIGFLAALPVFGPWLRARIALHRHRHAE
jgi:hypothetical protein